MFRFVQGCSGCVGGVDSEVDGMVGAVAVFLGFGVGVGADGVNFCQLGVNRCQVLVSVGEVGFLPAQE